MITPDLTGFLPPDPMEQVLQEQAMQQQQQEQQALLQALAQQQMTRGLGQDPQGNMSYTGGVSGYDGPTRPSDVPFKTLPIMGTPQQANQQQRFQGAEQGIGGLGGEVGRIAQLAHQMSQLGLPPKVQEAILEGAFPSIGNRKLEQRKQELQFRHDLMQPERDAKHDEIAQRLKEAERKATELERDRDSKNRVSEKNAMARLTEAFEAGERDPKKLAQIAKDMGWEYKGGTSESTGFMGMGGRTLNPRIGPVQTPSGRSESQGSALPKAPKPGTKLTDRALAKAFLDAAGGDIKRAEAAAKAQGWEF
jgi:hypothetical protein